MYRVAAPGTATSTDAGTEADYRTTGTEERKASDDHHCPSSRQAATGLRANGGKRAKADSSGTGMPDRSGQAKEIENP